MTAMKIGNDRTYEIPEYVTALLSYLIWEISRVYGNVKGDTWNEVCDPGIPGLRFRGYWWGPDEALEARLPNFQYHSVEISWYKHPGCGGYSNKNWSCKSWINWFNRCLETIRNADTKDY